MEPEVGFGAGTDPAEGGTPRPRSSLLLRAMEISGLALVIYGLGASHLLLVVPGAGLIIGSYALYRLRHGPGPAAGADGELCSDDPGRDGGGD
jgi:hypothetical protein